MNNSRRRWMRASGLIAVVALALPATFGPAHAADTTKVRGTITDAAGKPLEKVEVWFENANIKEKKVGPVKTNKKGQYVHPFLDIGIEPEWRVVPHLAGHLVLKVSWRLIDSQRNDRGTNEAILNQKQEIPSLHPVMVGSDGINEVNFVMVKEEEFNNALRKAVAEKQGTAAGAAPAPAPAGGGPPGAPAPGSAPSAPGEAEAPAAPAGSGKTVSEALALMAAGKNEEAIPILKEYLEKNPNNAPINFTLGKAYIQTKQFDLAIPPLQKSLEVKADQPGAHFYLGVAYSSLAQNDQALTEFLAEIPLSPAQDAAYSNAAMIYEKMGKNDEALEYYKKTLEVNSARADVHASLAHLYEQKGDRAAAEAEYQALASLDPGSAAVTWYNIGALAQNNDQNEKALQAFRKAVELDPQYAVAHRELGYALVKNGDFKEAAAHFEKYVTLAPKAADAAQVKDMARSLAR